MIISRGKGYIYYVIVLYNEYIWDSKTYRSLKTEDSNIILVDNSTNDRYKDANIEYTKAKNHKYMDMKGNKGLSKAYNTVIKEYLNKIEGYVVWLDSDTEIPADYFTNLKAVVLGKSGADIIVPIIKDKKGNIVSPNSKGILKNKPIKGYEENLVIRNFNAINSCTAVNIRLYEDYLYDERLFLDEVDHKFFDDFRDRRYNVMNVEVIQNFSQRDEKANLNGAWIRFKLRIADIIVYYKLRKLGILGLIKCILLSFQMVKTYKSPRFLKGIGFAIKSYIQRC